MILQVDKVTSWWKGKLMKRWLAEKEEMNRKVDKKYVEDMASWWNCKLTKWQVDEKASWWKSWLMKKLVDENEYW